jgi:uncharacterized protein (DUF433 family)
MPPTILTETIPLETDADGVIRMHGSRVTLDTVVGAFTDGATAEEIVQQYPTLGLADVYAVIGYYLHRRAEVDAYLSRRQEQGERVREQNESRFNPHGVRERLIARLKPRP